MAYFENLRTASIFVLVILVQLIFSGQASASGWSPTGTYIEQAKEKEAFNFLNFGLLVSIN